MKKLLAALFVAAIATLLGTVQSGGAVVPANKPVRVAYFMLAAANSYEAATLQGGKAAAKKYNANVTVFDGNFNTTKQYNQVQTALSCKCYDAFNIGPNSGAALVPLIKQAVAAGIKVSCHNSPCGPNTATLAAQVPGMVAQVGTNFVTVGTTLGKIAGQACQGVNPCNVAFMVGKFTFANDAARLALFKKEIKNFPNIKLVSVQEGGYLENASQTAMAGILTANPHLNAFVTAGDQMAHGAENALVAAHFKLGAPAQGGVAIISTAVSDYGLKALEQKRWYADTACAPYSEGYVSTQLIIEAARGKTGLPTSVDTDTLNKAVGQVVTQQNAHLFQAQYSG